MPIYKIRNKENGFYSNGIVRQTGWGANKGYDVTFNYKGKEWTEEKNLKNHLLKCMKSGIKMDTWEVVEVVYHPTKPIMDWFDHKMLIKVMK